MGAWGRSLVATAAMCAVVPFVRVGTPESSLWARAAGNLALPVALGIAVYVGAHALMRSPELRALRRAKS